jgi:predicted outer membrane repeat protein
MYRHLSFLSLIILLTTTLPLQANIIHVPGDSTTIQGGINGAVDGDTVMVSQGTYHEHDIDFLGKAITVMGTDPEDSAVVAATVVDADSLGRVFHFHTTEDSNSVLKGLTITGGGSEGGAGILCDDSSPKVEHCIITKNTALWSGGGISCFLGSPKIRNCIITENVVISGIGAGINCSRSSPSITDCTISGNRELDGAGGGMNCWDSSPVIENCIFQGNSALFNGGGMNIQESSPTIINSKFTQNNVIISYGGGIYSIDSSPMFISCTFNNNISMVRGGGLYFIDSTPVLSYCTISGNSANTGGGIRCQSSPLTMNNSLVIGNTANSGGAMELKHSDHIITNCTISENIANTEGGAIYCENASLSINNSIFWNDSPDEIFILSSPSVFVTYSDIQGGWKGQGNIDIDPLFRKPAIADFHLRAIVCNNSVDSPCIDIGNPALIDSILNCEWGLGTELSDMGAYGGGKALVGIADQKNGNQIPRRFTLNQNYPNPFNPSTTIQYDITVGNGTILVKILVYDIRGRLIRKLVDQKKTSGRYQVHWDGRDERGSPVSSGVYLYRIAAGDFSSTKKMVMVR